MEPFSTQTGCKMKFVLKPVYTLFFSLMVVLLSACGSSSSVSPDPVTLSIEAASIDVFERDGLAEININSSGPVALDTEVQLIATGTATAGDDYDGTLSVTIPAGSSSITFNLPIIDDDEIEGPETLAITLDSANRSFVSVDKSQSVIVTIKPYIKQLTNSPYSVCILTDDGEVKCWGSASYYNFGTGQTGEISDAPGEMGENLQAALTGDTKVTAIDNNQFITCALGTDALLRCWGKKTHVGVNNPSSYATDFIGDDLAELGNALPIVDLGTGRTVQQFSTSLWHACALLDNGRIKCWGDNGNGRLGIGDQDDRGDTDNEMGDNLPYVDLGTDSDSNPWTAKKVVAGYQTSCAILSNDQIKCWGRNSAGELGTGDTSARGDGLAADNLTPTNDMGNNLAFIDIGGGRTVKEVFPYYRRTCIILDDDSLKCLGAPGDGPFGADYITDQFTPVAIDTGGLAVLDVGMSEYSACVLLENNQLKCLGDNGYGQLGHDQNYGRYGQNAGETLVNAPVTDLGTERYAVALPDGGYDFSCALLNTNEVKCWGGSDVGAMGNADLYNIDVGDGEDELSNPLSEMGDNLPAVDWY